MNVFRFNFFNFFGRSILSKSGLDGSVGIFGVVLVLVRDRNDGGAGHVFQCVIRPDSSVDQ